MIRTDLPTGWLRTLLLLFLVPATTLAAHNDRHENGPTPQLAAGCTNPGDNPETGVQGRRYREAEQDFDFDNDITCNTRRVSSYTFMSDNFQANAFGTVGGFKVHRYVDSSGNVCAIYDSTLMYPTNVFDTEGGVNILDMSDPAKPALTFRLPTPAMLSPHESLVISHERGLLAAVLGNLSLGPGVVDVYSLEPDCRTPILQASAPVGVFGHEGGMSPDGRIFYSASPGTPTLTAVDLTTPNAPRPIWTGEICAHGLSISGDGRTAFVAHTPCDGDSTGFAENGLLILDVSQVHEAAGDLQKVGHPLPGQDPTPLSSEPEVSVLGRVTWANTSIPQNAIPVTIQGRTYVVEIDEYARGPDGHTVGAGRMIGFPHDAAGNPDYTAPAVLSDMRLAVHEPAAHAEYASDPGAATIAQGYAGHYCAVPTPDNPTIVACGMIVSGLRIFDIRDPAHPVETGYFNASVPPRQTPHFVASNWVMSAPAFDPEKKEIWYTDGYSGFYVIQVNDAGWPDWDGPCSAMDQDLVFDGLRCDGSEVTPDGSPGRSAGKGKPQNVPPGRKNPPGR